MDYICSMKCPLCDHAEGQFWQASPDGNRYYHCPRCDLVWLDPEMRLDRDAERAYYSTHHNDTWNPTYLDYLSRLADPTLEGMSSESKGVDYGCGPTEGMKVLLEPKGFRINSFDPIFFPKYETLRSVYDFLLCSEAVEHFRNPGVEFARWKSLVREGGRIGVSSRLRVDDATFADWYYRKDPTHVVFYSSRTVDWIAARFGWRLLRLDSPLWIFTT